MAAAESTKDTADATDQIHDCQNYYHSRDPGREMHHRVRNRWMAVHWAILIAVRSRDIHSALSIEPKLPECHGRHTTFQIMKSVSCRTGLQLQHSQNPQFVRTTKDLYRRYIVILVGLVDTIKDMPKALRVLLLHALRNGWLHVRV